MCNDCYDKQKEALRANYEHKSAKEIALELAEKLKTTQPAEAQTSEAEKKKK
jgi:hypothetical protein